MNVMKLRYVLIVCYLKVSRNEEPILNSDKSCVPINWKASWSKQDCYLSLPNV